MSSIGRNDVARLLRAGAALAALALAFGADGCDRAPRFVPESHDSTAAMPADSFATAVDAARSAWESGAGRDDGSAATATARLVLTDLRAHPDDPLDRRARRFLDSLGFGAELAGRPEVALVNLFATADPDGGSWPYLFWREDGSVRVQAVEGSGMRLHDLAARPAAAGDQVAALFTRSSGSGPQPLVFAWRRPPNASQWSLHQTLGPDSLGGVGVARFVSPGPDSAVLETRTWSRTVGFEECAACPHVYRSRRFRWDEAGFSTAANQVEETPYVAFVRFVQALAAADPGLARELAHEGRAVDVARQSGFAERRGTWRVAPGTEEPGADMTFLRGTREAYRVRFVREGGRWLVDSIEPTDRAIE